MICKPDAVERGLVGEIVGRLERKGLVLVAAELRTITAELAGAHYAEHRGKPFFDDLVLFITRSPVLALVVEGPEDTYRVVRTLMGATDPLEAAPGTVRGDLAIRDEREPDPRLGLSRVGRTGDRALLSRSGLNPGPATAAPDHGVPSATEPPSGVCGRGSSRGKRDRFG